jgi:hypothetical protein
LRVRTPELELGVEVELDPREVLDGPSRLRALEIAPELLARKASDRIEVIVSGGDGNTDVGYCLRRLSTSLSTCGRSMATT